MQEPCLPGVDSWVQGPIPPGGKEEARGFCKSCLLLLLTPVPGNFGGYSTISHDLTRGGPLGRVARGEKGRSSTRGKGGDEERKALSL